MDLLTKSDLELLGQRGQPETCVSPFIATHWFGSGIQADRIRRRKLLAQVESVLSGRGLRAPDVTELLKPAPAVPGGGIGAVFRYPAGWS